MSGLDSMKRQILDEANDSAQKQIADAKAKAEEIIKKATDEAKIAFEEAVYQSQEAAKNYTQRIEFTCEMQRKQEILQAKQEVIKDVLDKAYEQVQNLDTETYFQMIQNILRKYVLAQDGVVYFSSRDMERMPQGFEETIQKIAQEKGGMLTLSKETKDIDGGCLLSYGGIEENCTIKALFHMKRDELSDQAYKVLFI